MVLRIAQSELRKRLLPDVGRVRVTDMPNCDAHSGCCGAGEQRLTGFLLGSTWHPRRILRSYQSVRDVHSSEPRLIS